MSSGRPILLTTDAVGGVWTYSLALADGVARRGIPTILAILGPPATADQLRQARAIPGCTVIETGLDLDWTARAPADLAHSESRLIDIATRHHARSAHLHSPALSRTRWKLPVVAVAHSCTATWWRATHGTDLPADLAWRAAAMSAGLAMATRIIAPSHAFAAQLRACYGLPRKDIAIVHNGTAPGPILHTHRQEFVLAAGRLWDAAKNMDLLDRLAGRTGLDIRLAGPLTGPGGQHFAGRHARTLGMLPPAPLRLAMAQAAIFAAPSRYEPFGLSVLEAAQQGTPLLLADIPTFRELWQDAALFAPPDDEDAWANALTSLLAHPAARASWGQRAKQRAALYTPDAMVAQTLSHHPAGAGQTLQPA
jgi:glycosyltransferase involved in cell wall biosynthesis